ncbi:hypothetical protein [Desmospora profundinema]|uniref:Uncharacterized protein n=1 Tax=Desmospora profundinema TaxID=1571184 RepID=A0ABU1IKN6_9BACL|nr:hypothetical protein [Desmospora profundinema]MDR6224534.1 hypothetical protein [Desmospora profundinema]
MRQWFLIAWVWLLSWTAVSRFPPEPEAGVAGWWRWVSMDYAVSLVCLVWASWLIVAKVRKCLGWVLQLPLPLLDRRRWGPALAILPIGGAGFTLIGYLPGHAAILFSFFVLREWIRWQASCRALTEQEWGER